jgi:NAD(P)-dependent dehydrogenase (short-subunit alcohol dehydrogenase family)
MSTLRNKVVVITGAGSGLGREYALAFAKHGASVVVNDYGAAVTAEKLAINPADAVVAEIIALGGTAIANTASVSDWVGAESIIETAVMHFGRLDAVVNNAGNNRPSSLVELSQLDLDSQIDVHLKGTLAVSHFAAQHWNKMGPEADRAIVNTTSAVGLHPTAGGGVYGAAKAGIAAATVSHAQELARLGVKVNALAPCARTRMVKESPSVLAMMPASDEFDRHAPEHSAPLVAYLASSLNRFTGRIFAVEGPDLALYTPFSVEEHWSTQGAWTIEGIAETLESVNVRTNTEAFFPGGVVQHGVPSGRTLKMLTDVADSSIHR